MRTFTVNGIIYKAKEPDFNFMADYAGSLSNTMKAVRAYLAFCSGMTEEQAGIELNKFIISGGKLDDIMSCLDDGMENSGFFRKVKENAEQSNTESNEQEEKEEVKAKRKMSSTKQ